MWFNDATFYLNLPAHMRLHLVFHNSLLEPCHTSLIPNRVVPPPPSVQLVDGPEYEVTAILDSKIMRNKLYYLVDWVGSCQRLPSLLSKQTGPYILVVDFHSLFSKGR